MDDEVMDDAPENYEYGWEHSDAFDKPDEIADESEYVDDDALYIQGRSSNKDDDDDGQ